jgi:hypothetical protein
LTQKILRENLRENLRIVRKDRYTVLSTSTIKSAVMKPEGKRPLVRPRRRWVVIIRIDLGEVGWGDVDWIGLAQDRNRWRVLVNSVLNLRVP